MNPTILVAFTCLSLLVQPLNFGSETNIIYFLVEEREVFNRFNDSFVLPLVLPEHIEHARHLIEVPTSNDRIVVVARVGQGADGINRDYLTADKQPWSWHVTEAMGFGDDVPGTPASTSPSQIETNSTTWFDTFGRNGAYFPFYRVTRELGPNPLWLISRLEGDVLNFEWAALGSGFAYTIEEGTGLNDWQPLEGGNWPVTNTTFSVPVSGTKRFFRVRAQITQ